MAVKVPKRIAMTLINSLKGGVVPRIGLEYIAVGRKEEIGALLDDVEMIAGGGSSFRFIVGRYGSGKSFLLQTVRGYAMERGFAVMDADLSPERKLVGGKGQGLATYRELMKNLAVRTKPDGNALPLILERWISGVKLSLIQSGVKESAPTFTEQVEEQIFSVIGQMEDLVHGFDFAKVLTLYWKSICMQDDALRSNVLRWFRGEYQTKTEAKNELGVNAIVTDDDWYDYVKLFSAFLTAAGYRGMLLMIDELVNIYRTSNAVARQYNYEKLLTMYNDMMQGRASHLGIIMCGTVQSLEDSRRGVYSYEALRSRLERGRFAGEDTRNMLSPVISLKPLSQEELLILIERLDDIHAGLYGTDPALSIEDDVDFLRVEFSRVGAGKLITPREIIRDYIELLEIVMQNPDVSASQIIREKLPANLPDKEAVQEQELTEFIF